MATGISAAGFTFNPEELKDLSEIIHELVYANEELSRIHDINEGVKHNKQIVFAGKMALMGKVSTGCTPDEVPGVSLTQKFWTPVREDFRISHCSADVNAQDKLINQMAKMNPDFYNIIEGSQTSVGQFLIAKVIEGFQENLLRKVWFNDTAAATLLNGGSITDFTDVGYFNSFDGLFKQIQTEISSPDKNYVEVLSNRNGTYATQALSAGDTLALFKKMKAAADSRLLTHPNVTMYVTRSIWEGYENDLEDAKLTGAGNTLMTEEGVTRLFYKGIELIQMEVWDRNIEAYYNDGTKLDKPNRAILTIPENIPLATLATSDWGELDAFYDRTLKTNFIDGIYTIDAKFLEPYMAVAAY